MSIILFTITLLIGTTTMAQKIEFNENGLNFLQLNTKISPRITVPYEKIQSHSALKKMYTPWFPEAFTYYFIPSDSITFLENGVIKDIFFACDRLDRIRGIFLVLESSNDSLLKELDSIFDPVKLFSTSSFPGSSTANKRFWKKNDTVVFFKQYTACPYAEISITNCSFDEKSPGISVSTMYQHSL